MYYFLGIDFAIHSTFAVPLPYQNQEFPNLFLTMYPFGMLTDPHVPRKLLVTKRLSKIIKIH